MTRKVRQPCLATTYAYDATLACGRPEGHSKAKKDGSGYIWEGGHSERPFPSDPPTYRPREYTAFRASGEVANP